MDKNTEMAIHEKRKIMMAEAQNLPIFESIPLKMGPNQKMITEPFEYINHMYMIQYTWNMGPRGLKTFLKRIIRRVIKCVLRPLMDMQNELNRNYVLCINELVDRVYQLEEDNKKLSHEMEILRRKVH